MNIKELVLLHRACPTCGSTAYADEGDTPAMQALRHIAAASDLLNQTFKLTAHTGADGRLVVDAIVIVAK